MNRTDRTYSSIHYPTCANVKSLASEVFLWAPHGDSELSRRFYGEPIVENGYFHGFQIVYSVLLCTRIISIFCNNLIDNNENIYMFFK